MGFTELVNGRAKLIIGGVVLLIICILFIVLMTKFEGWSDGWAWGMWGTIAGSAAFITMIMMRCESDKNSSSFIDFRKIPSFRQLNRVSKPEVSKPVDPPEEYAFWG